MKENKTIKLVLKSFNTFFSLLSFGVLLATFINAIISSSVIDSIPLTMFIFFASKITDCLEKILYKKFEFGQYSIKLNIVNLLIVILFSVANLFFFITDTTQVALMVFIICDLLANIYLLGIECIGWVKNLYSYQNK